jgi:hypothetical protein
MSRIIYCVIVGVGTSTSDVQANLSMVLLITRHKIESLAVLTASLFVAAVHFTF